MSSLLKKHQEFKKSVATQQVFSKPVVNHGTPNLKRSGPIPESLAPMNRHTLSILYSIINHLKHIQRPQTIEDIQKFTRTVVDQALESQLRINDKPVYDIKSKEDLLELLKIRVHSGGLAVKELKDSYIDLTNIIEELKQEAKILTIDNKDGTPRVLFYNKMPARLGVKEEFKQVWLELKVPDETALLFEMERAGLKQMEMEKRKY
ncbi:hypothetical protein BB561_006257 [Smittium simulii]|uniref:TFA2 Winged helix domain-containing protein n=1 Tax=Smittium simulii TaxID=133385 RepID=A0A2T9Y5J5_9FUNG|nr:hypothetical protein BB561_006257 [Smittium simulii]